MLQRFFFNFFTVKKFLSLKFLTKPRKFYKDFTNFLRSSFKPWFKVSLTYISYKFTYINNLIQKEDFKLIMKSENVKFLQDRQNFYTIFTCLISFENFCFTFKTFLWWKNHRSKFWLRMSCLDFIWLSAKWECFYNITTVIDYWAKVGIFTGKFARKFTVFELFSMKFDIESYEKCWI